MNLTSRLIALLLFLLVQPVFAQSPYQLNGAKELYYFGTGIVTLGTGIYLQESSTLFTTDELSSMDPNDINGFDRIATDFSSMRAHRMSNYFFYGSFALPAAFLAGKKTRNDFGNIAFLWGETMLVTAGLTQLSKHAFRRPRPYVFDETAELHRKQSANAKASFVSGHTSMTAAGTFFFAKVYADHYPESSCKPLVWTLAATVPAITGYLRVRAGRHYPTDTIAGYVLGAAAGWMIPHLHRHKGAGSNGLHIYGGMNGLLVRYEF